MLKSFFEKHTQEAMEKIEVDHELKRHLGKELFDTSAKNPFLSLIITTMKRYSFPALAGLTVMAFVITSIFRTPLEPEEVLAKVLENYEQEEGMIYYEKTLTQYFDPPGFDSNVFLEEIYKTSDQKKYLSIQKDGETDDIIDISLRLTDEFGDTQMGHKNYTEEELDLDNEGILSFNPPSDPERDEWIESFKGEKIYCVKRLETETALHEAFLTVSADDYSVYKVDGTGGTKPQLTQEELDTNKLLELNQNQSLAKDYIQGLINQRNYDYSTIIEDDQMYHLFKMPMDPNYIEDSIWFYISAKTNALVYYDVYFGSQHMHRVTLIESDSFSEDEQPELFNPNRFEGLKMRNELTVGSDLYNFEEEGCYDNWGQKLSDSILDDFPTEATEKWEELNQMMMKEAQAQIMDLSEGRYVPPEVTTYCGENCTDPSEAEEVEGVEEFESSQLDLDITDAHMPSSGVLTQGYQGTHLAWDLAQKEGRDQSVYAVLPGEVLQAKMGGWNGGYGNMIVIDHGNGLQSLYAHLDQVNVEVGQLVSAGEVMGTIGETGRVMNGPHLHFELHKDGMKIDPGEIF